MDDTTSQPAGNTRGISLIGLIALVISSSIGSGVFALSTDISAAAAPGPALIAWLIAGIGFMALATTFGRLSVVRPDLNGIVDYAREGFGPFVGLVSGWGYWLSIWIGNVAFGVMLVTAIGYFFPPFSSGLTAAGVAFISVLNWAIVLLVNRGVEEASALNAIVMVCKLVPIFAFILAMVVMFDPAVFTADFWGNLANNLSDPALAPGSVPTQIVNCFMVMMWVFVGMEGASVLGHRARRKSDVSRATILGAPRSWSSTSPPPSCRTATSPVRSSWRSDRPPCPISSSAWWVPGEARSSRASPATYVTRVRDDTHDALTPGRPTGSRCCRCS